MCEFSLATSRVVKSQEDKQGVPVHVEDIEGRKVVLSRSISKGRRVSLRRTDEHIVMGSRGAGDFGLYVHGHLVIVVAKIESAV